MTHSGHVPSITLWAIICCYLVIAWQFRGAFSFTQSTDAKKGLSGLIMIFVFCAISGYLPNVIKLPPIVPFISHHILLAAAVYYIIKKQAANVMKSMED